VACVPAWRSPPPTLPLPSAGTCLPTKDGDDDAAVVDVAVPPLARGHRRGGVQRFFSEDARLRLRHRLGHGERASLCKEEIAGDAANYYDDGGGDDGDDDGE